MISGLTVTHTDQVNRNLNFWFLETRLREYENEKLVLVLVLDGTRFRFSEADAGGFHTRQWRDTALSWSAGDRVEVQIVRGGSSGNQQAATPLTATLEDVPATHDGSSAFTFRIAFSAEVTILSLDMRDHALTVAGGTVTTAERVDGRTDLWEITVEPSGSGSVSILVPQGRACTETGALCTADGRMLSTGLGQSVPFAAPEAQGHEHINLLGR